MFFQASNNELRPAVFFKCLKLTTPAATPHCFRKFFFLNSDDHFYEHNDNFHWRAPRRDPLVFFFDAVISLLFIFFIFFDFSVDDFKHNYQETRLTGGRAASRLANVMFVENHAH